ncbi:hypothetical protein ACFWNH_30525 [Rhodococcus qingshengii]|uniref:hypothetical protein n=1 Tax=Rhodococcus qingshengii TaxID=334542 RepID=UPI00364D4404
MNSSQLFVLGAFATGLLSLAFQIIALCLGSDDDEWHEFIRAANAVAVLAVALVIFGLCFSVVRR